VHIGKAAGTSARLDYWITFKGSSLNTGYVHGSKPDVDKFDTFIFTVRNPIDRMKSWFLYVHPKNNQKVGISHKKAELFDCYNQFDHLVTYGLKRGINETPDYCQILARNVIQGFDGSRAEYVHASRNYKFYTAELLDKADEKNIYVLRTENLVYDWTTTAKDLLHKIGSNNTIRMNTKVVTHREGKTIKVRSREISESGLKNLCYFLCPEIQLYKDLLKRAINLSIKDKFDSLLQLTKTCGKEARTTECSVSI